MSQTERLEQKRVMHKSTTRTNQGAHNECGIVARPTPLSSLHAETLETTNRGDDESENNWLRAPITVAENQNMMA